MAIQKKISTIFLSALIAVFLIQAIAATALILLPATAQADSTFTFEVPILHGQEQTVTFNSKSGTKPIADYIKTIYTFAVGAVGIVAAVVLMIGGVMWITAGGNASNVSEAKSMITASLTGMILVLCSYLILGQINPALVNLQADIIAPVPSIAMPAPTSIMNTKTCTWKDACATCVVARISHPPIGQINYDMGSSQTVGIVNGKISLGTGDDTRATIVVADSVCGADPFDKGGIHGPFNYCSCSYPKDPNQNCTWLIGCDPYSYNIIPFDPNSINDNNSLALSSCGSYLAEADYDCCCKSAHQ